MSGCNCVPFWPFFRVHDLFQPRKLKSSALGICLVSHSMPFFNNVCSNIASGTSWSANIYTDKNSSFKGKGKAWPHPMAGGQIPDARTGVVHGVREKCTICFENSGLTKWLWFHVTAKVRAIQSFIHTHLAFRLVGSGQNLEMRWKSVTHNISTKTCSSLVLYLNCGPCLTKSVNAVWSRTNVHI